METFWYWEWGQTLIVRETGFILISSYLSDNWYLLCSYTKTFNSRSCQWGIVGFFRPQKACRTLKIWAFKGCPSPAKEMNNLLHNASKTVGFKLRF